MWNHIHIVVNRDQGATSTPKSTNRKWSGRASVSHWFAPFSMLSTSLSYNETRDQHTYQYVRPMMHRQNKIFWSKQPRSTKTYHRTKRHYFPHTINLRKQPSSHSVIFSNFKSCSLDWGRLRGRVRPGDYNDWDQGTKDKGTVGWFNIRQNIKRNVISYDTSTAGQAGGGSFKKETNDKPKKQFAYRMPRKMTLQHHQMLHLPRTRQSCL